MPPVRSLHTALCTPSPDTDDQYLPAKSGTLRSLCIPVRVPIRCRCSATSTTPTWQVLPRRQPSNRCEQSSQPARRFPPALGGGGSGDTAGLRHGPLTKLQPHGAPPPLCAAGTQHPHSPSAAPPPPPLRSSGCPLVAAAPPSTAASGPASPKVPAPGSAAGPGSAIPFLWAAACASETAAEEGRGFPTAPLTDGPGPAVAPPLTAADGGVAVSLVAELEGEWDAVEADWGGWLLW
jgi:hypothetical protein